METGAQDGTRNAEAVRWTHQCDPIQINLSVIFSEYRRTSNDLCLELGNHVLSPLFFCSVHTHSTLSWFHNLTYCAPLIVTLYHTHWFSSLFFCELHDKISGSLVYCREQGQILCKLLVNASILLFCLDHYIGSGKCGCDHQNVQTQWVPILVQKYVGYCPLRLPS